MTFDVHEISPLEWDDMADGFLDLVDNEIRAAEMLLNADPPLAMPSIPHSLIATEYLLFLAVQLLGASKQSWTNVDEYIKFIAEKAPDLRRTLGPLTPLKKAAAAGAFDEDIFKVAESAFKATVKAEKILGEFIDKKLEELYAEHETSPASPSGGSGGRGNEYGQAMEILDKAWGETSVKKRATLVKKALALCPDIADAYVILGNDALDSGKPEEAIEHYRRGVEAGERELGAEAFTDDKGHFWGLLETRPYMRARFGLASALHKSGSVREAAEHYKAMLELNPNDNQGVRYMLIEALLLLGEHQDADALLKQYDEESAFMLYPKALLEFVKNGDSKAAQKLRAEAIRNNPHVPAFLLGKKKLPKKTPDSYGFKDESEAVVYALEFGAPWSTIPGAKEWLAQGV